ncbi:MAG TPA: SDR family oxidoreductase [Acidimicrobiales bacterium]|jgi:NAD(P)-dependent dehydrogenase (short-subunit alcohol dehydrogenase family)
MDLGLKDSVVVINGGSAGMGRAAALCFAAEGARLAILARDPERLDATVDQLRAAGGQDPVGIPTDLTDSSSVENSFAEISERWPHVNVLVNAAGPTDVGIGRLGGISDREWLDTMEIGLLSAVRCVREALPQLRKASWARIVNVSAHSTRRQSPDLVAYTASKAALTSFSKNLSQTLAPEGILVNTVSPGSFLSQGMKAYLSSLPPDRKVDPDSLVDAMRIIAEDFGHPAYLGRAGDPAEIGPVIAFVGSQLNSYMTGADINVDGGSDF